ncbi:MAG: sulfur carrier protein ThiS [Acidimicrobiales bacterium]
MTIVVNGEAQALDGPLSLDDLVDAMGFERQGLAIAVNDEVVPRSTWPDRAVGDGDRVEILNIAQGG